MTALRRVRLSRRAGRAIADSGVALALRGVGGLLAIVWEFSATRQAGAQVAGRFFLAFTIVSLVSTIGRFGLDVLVYQETAVASPTGTGSRLHGYRRLAGVTLASSAVLVALIGAAFGGVLFGAPSVAPVLVVTSLAVVPLGVLAIEAEGLKAAGRIASAATRQSVVGPVVALALLYAYWQAPSASVLALIYCVGVAVAAGDVWRRRVRHARSVPVKNMQLLREGTPYALTAAVSLAIGWVGVIVVGITSSAREVSEIFLADRVTSLGTMLVVAVNAAVGADMARAASRGDLERADHIRRRVQVAMLPVAALYLVAVAAAAPHVDRFAGASWGDDFAKVLLVLAIGQSAVIVGGPSTMFLMMCRGQRWMARVALATLAVAVITQATFTPTWGLTGAAWAISITWCANRLLLWGAVRVTMRQGSS